MIRMLCSFLLLTTLGLSDINADKPYFVYGASATSQEVVSVKVEQKECTPELKILQRLELGFEAAPMVYHPDLKLLYIASLRDKTGAGNKCAVLSTCSSGKLTLKKTVSFQHGSAYLSLDRTGKYLLYASYFDGDVDIYHLDAEGIPSKRVHHQHEERDKAHAILTSPDNQFAYVPYVKNQNGLFQYKFEEKTGGLSSMDPHMTKLPSGIGPRHMAFHPSKPYLFFSNEQHQGASSFRVMPDGNLVLVDVEEAKGHEPADGLMASDIYLTPNGQFLYVPVRDFGNGVQDAIHAYRIHDDGTLTHIQKLPCDPIPWGLNVTADGRHLLLTAAKGNTLTFYAIDEDGTLKKQTHLEWGNMIRDIIILE